MNLARNYFVIFVLFITTSFAQEVVNVKHPDWSYNKTIYEVNVRQYTQEGTFKALEKQLPRLKELGVGILWLMPINPIGEVNRKGTLGSYYSVRDYLDVNPEFGTKEDFKSLVKAIHKAGMYVIIDWVANHTAWDNPLVKEHPEWFTKNEKGEFIPPVADWQDVIDLNYDNKELHRYMTDALLYWVKNYDIDGYRCDVAGMVPMEFWDKARKELDGVKKVFMLAEDESPKMHVDAFDMTYSWEVHHIQNDIAKGKKDASAFKEYFANEKTKFHPKAFRMRFTSNHDENTWNGTEFERMGEAAEVMNILNNFIPGMNLIYSGQEAALSKRLNFFEKDPIDWKKHEYADLYKKLNNLKKDKKVLWNGEKGGDFNILETANEKEIFAFTRSNKNEKVIVVLNLSDKEVEGKITNTSLKGNYTNFATNKKEKVGTDLSYKLGPWEYKVLVK